MNLTKRQKEILEAAVSLIAQRGVQELTIKNLAAELDLTEPALYRHFSGKNEIIKTLITQFDEAFPTQKCRSRGMAAIREFVTARMHQLLKRPALAKVMFSEEFFISDPVFSEQIMQMMHRHKGWFTDRLAEGAADGTIRSDMAPDTIFRLIMGPVRLLFKQWGMSGMKFDLLSEGNRLLDAMELMLRKEN